MTAEQSDIASRVSEIRRLVHQGHLTEVPDRLKDLAAASSEATEEDSKLILDLAIEIATHKAAQHQKPE